MIARAEALARYPVDRHAEPADPAHYARELRDTVGSGEGIFGLIDSASARLAQLSSEFGTAWTQIRSRSMATTSNGSARSGPPPWCVVTSSHPSGVAR